MTESVEYRGKVYESRKALAEAYGLTYFCCCNRLERGIPLDMPPLKNGKWELQPVEYDGKTYPSMYALAEAYGWSVMTTKQRLSQHVPLTGKVPGFFKSGFVGASYWSLGGGLK